MRVEMILEDARTTADECYDNATRPWIRAVRKVTRLNRVTYLAIVMIVSIHLNEMIA